MANKKALKTAIICIVSAIVLVASIVGAVMIIKFLGVDTSVATPDETTLPAATVTESTENTDMTTPDGKVYDVHQDWDELARINTDIKAWIDVPGTVINYPVLKYEGDGYGSQYYLHRNYDGSYLYAGSIFIDYRSSEGVDSRNIITHGHSMNDGSMYKALIDYGKYEGDLDFYKKHPTLFFNTPEGNEQWIIFSVYKTNTLESHGDFFNYLMGSFESDAQFMNYIYNVKVRSLFDVPVPINEDDQIITLSTCSYEYTDFRTVVAARKIRPGEDVRDIVKNTTINEQAVWPEVHHNATGTTRPEVTTFKTENQAGNIDWYDGDGNLSGSEWLTSTTGNNTYTVTFINYDGSIISTQSVPRGHDAIPPKDPVKPENDYYYYVFEGWQLDYTNVDCNMTIAPNFKRVEK
ncbi:MAG: class B sortase [Ruminococcus sp.]